MVTCALSFVHVSLQEFIESFPARFGSVKSRFYVPYATLLGFFSVRRRPAVMYLSSIGCRHKLRFFDQQAGAIEYTAERMPQRDAPTGHARDPGTERESILLTSNFTTCIFEYLDGR